VDLLGQLGAVTGDDSATAAVTALGQWSVAMSADVVVEVLADCVRRGADPWRAVRRWLESRQAADAARELLTAAADLSAAARIGAGDVADGLGEEALAGGGRWRIFRIWACMPGRP
jgi:hypothetical protein